MNQLQLAVGGADAGLAGQLDEEISAVNAAASGHDDARMLSAAVRGGGGDLRAGPVRVDLGGCGHDDIHLVKRLTGPIGVTRARQA